MDKIFNKSLLGLNIKHLRSKSGLTQGKLSGILGVKSTTLSNWEVGLASPDMDIIAKISNYFGVSLDLLAFTSHLDWQNNNNSVVNISKDLLPAGPCRECELRDEIISEKNEIIYLLKEKIRSINDRSSNDNRQTG